MSKVTKGKQISQPQAFQAGSKRQCLEMEGPPMQWLSLSFSGVSMNVTIVTMMFAEETN